MLTDFQFRVACAGLLVFGFGASAWMRSKADRARGEFPRSADPGHVALLLRVAGGIYYGSLLLWLAYPRTVIWAAIELAPTIRWTGAVVACVGTALGLWSLWHLGQNVTPTSAVRPETELVESGPYRWIRHPLYSSMLLTIPGFVLLSANSLVLLGGAVTFGVIAYRTRREERQLIGRLGGVYVRYMDRTGRFFPGIG